MRIHNTLAIIGIVLGIACSATQADAIILSTPSPVSAVATSSSRITVTWNDSNVGLTGFAIERSLKDSTGFKVIAKLSGGSVRSYQDSNLSPATTYYYRVRALYNGTMSRRSAVASATTFVIDTTAPSVPTGFTATAMTCSRIDLRWNASSDIGSGLRGYNIYRNGSFVRQVTSTSSSEINLAASTSYGYQVSAVDNGGNESARQQATASTTTCTVATTIPTRTATATPIRTSTPLRTATRTATPIATTTPLRTATRTATAIRTATPVVTATRTATPIPTATPIIDGIAPSAPSGLNVGMPACNQTTLSWTSSADSGGSGLKGYNVYRNGGFLKQIMAPSTSTSDSAVAGGTSYSYALRAFDNAGNISGYSAAVGATTPSCVTTGTSAPWAKRFGGAGLDAGEAVAVDGNRDIVVAGAFTGSADFGGGSLGSAGGLDVFLAKYSSTGTHLWSKHIGSIGDDRAYSVAVDRSANCDGAGGTNCVVVAGYFTNTADFDPGLGIANRTSLGAGDIFVAKYSSAGTYLWARQYGGTSTGYKEYGYGVAVDSRANCDGSGNPSATGCILLTGAFRDSMDVGGQMLSGALGFNSLFVAKLSSSGSRIWAKTYANTTDAFGFAVAVNSDGDLALTGSFRGSIDFGTGMKSSWGNDDLFVAKLRGTDGSGIWANRYGSDGAEKGYGVVFDGSGNIAVTGSFSMWSGGVSFGGSTWSANGTDMFVVQLNGANGAHQWSRRCTGTYTNSRQGSSVATDDTGNVVIIGHFYGSLNCGTDTPTLTGVGYADVLAAKFSPSGAPIWMTRFGAAGASSIGNGVAVDPASDEVVLTGTFQGRVDVGSQSLSSVGLDDVFLVRMLP